MWRYLTYNFRIPKYKIWITFCDTFLLFPKFIKIFLGKWIEPALSTDKIFEFKVLISFSRKNITEIFLDSLKYLSWIGELEWEIRLFIVFSVYLRHCLLHHSDQRHYFMILFLINCLVFMTWSLNDWLQNKVESRQDHGFYLQLCQVDFLSCEADPGQLMSWRRSV